MGPITVYNKGPVKRSIYIYFMNVIQLLKSGGGIRGLGLAEVSYSRLPGSGFRVQGVGLLFFNHRKVSGLGFWVHGLTSKSQVEMFRV